MRGEPCPGCGCPYPGDHTQECQWPEKEQLLRAVDAMGVFLGELNTAIGKMRAEFEAMAKQHNPKDEDLSPA